MRPRDLWGHSDTQQEGTGLGVTEKVSMFCEGILTFSYFEKSCSKPFTLHLHEEVADPSQAVGDARFGLSQPVVVRDADIVHVFQKGVFSREHQVIQTFWPRLLHSLKAELNVDGKFLQNGEEKSNK